MSALSFSQSRIEFNRSRFGCGEAPDPVSDSLVGPIWGYSGIQASETVPAELYYSLTQGSHSSIETYQVRPALPQCSKLYATIR